MIPSNIAEPRLDSGYSDEDSEQEVWDALQDARAGALDDLEFLLKEWVGPHTIDMDAIAYHHLVTIDRAGMSTWEALDYLAGIVTGLTPD